MPQFCHLPALVLAKTQPAETKTLRALRVWVAIPFVWKASSSSFHMPGEGSQQSEVEIYCKSFDPDLLKKMEVVYCTRTQFPKCLLADTCFGVKIRVHILITQPKWLPSNVCSSKTYPPSDESCFLNVWFTVLGVPFLRAANCDVFDLVTTNADICQSYPTTVGAEGQSQK